jgi:hypothetical protein
MSVKIWFQSLDVTAAEEGFNWAHRTVRWPGLEASEGIAQVNLRVPRKLQSLDEIKTHALNRLKELLQEVLEAEYPY